MTAKDVFRLIGLATLGIVVDDLAAHIADMATDGSDDSFDPYYRRAISRIHKEADSIYRQRVAEM